MHPKAEHERSVARRFGTQNAFTVAILIECIENTRNQYWRKNRCQEVGESLQRDLLLLLLLTIRIGVEMQIVITLVQLFHFNLGH